MKLHLEYGVQFWFSQYKALTCGNESIGGPSRWPGKWSTWHMRRGLGLFSLKKARFGRDLTAVYNCLTGRCSENGVRFLLVVHSGRMIGKGQKLEHGKLSLDKDIIFYHEGWSNTGTHCLEDCRISTVEVFKAWWDTARATSSNETCFEKVFGLDTSSLYYSVFLWKRATWKPNKHPYCTLLWLHRTILKPL